MPVSSSQTSATTPESSTAAAAVNDDPKYASNGADAQREPHPQRDDLWSKLLTVSQRQYFFDVRENSRGKYLKLTEVGESRSRSTVLVAPRVFRTLRSLLVGAIQGQFDGVETSEANRGVMASRYDDVGAKKYYMDVIHNPQRGRYVKVVEAQAARGRSVVVLPESGWLQTKRLFEELVKEVPEFDEAPAVIKLAPGKPPVAQNATKAKGDIANAKQEAGSGAETNSDATESDNIHATGNAPSADEAASREKQSNTAVTQAPRGNHSKPSAGDGVRKTVIASRGINADHRRFFLDLLENEYGRTLKIAQMKVNNRRETVMLPSELLPALAQLLKAIESGDMNPKIPSLEAMSVPQLNTQDPEADSRRPRAILGRSFKSKTRKLFFLDLMEGSRGRFLRIAESSQQRAQPRRTSVAIPDVCLLSLRQVVEEFVSIQPPATPSS